MVKSNKYALRYTFRTEIRDDGYEKKDVKNKFQGLADALIIVSLLRGGSHAHAGATSHMIMTCDGQNKCLPIPSSELFTHVFMLADQLSKDKTIHEWQRQMLSGFVDCVRGLMKYCHKKE